MENGASEKGRLVIDHQRYFCGKRNMEEHGDCHMVVIDDDELVSSFKRKQQAIDGIFRQYQSCTIYRVIPYVQVEDNASFHPRVISIGPFHKGMKSFEEMEELKLRYLCDFLKRCQVRQPLEKFITEIRKHEVEARNQYSEEVGIDQNAFVEMMVLDGCFIIEFLLKWYSRKIYGQLCIAPWSLPLLRNDLLLLENQIPFFIPQTLYSIAKIEFNDGPPTFMHLAVTYLTRRTREILPAKKNFECYHLLHLLHQSLNPKFEPKKERTFSFWQTKILSLLQLVSSKKPSILQCNSGISMRPHQLVRGAVDLEEAGITFEKEETTHCFLKIKFVNGKLMIPSLLINPVTVSLLLNLLAFEQARTDVGNYITCYVDFMDSIVSKPADVAVLQCCQIIKSQLRNDEDVALFFNKLGNGVPRGWKDDRSYLANVVQEVNDYCKKRHHRDLTALKKNYFVNPWRIISVITGLVLLLLTAMQTIFTILPYIQCK